MSYEFDSAMHTAMEFQRDGRHEDALALRFEAYDLTESGSIDHGRAARDIAASYDRLGNLNRAQHYAMEAHETHKSIVDQDRRDKPARRELGATQIYIGTVGLRNAIAVERETGVVDAEATGNTLDMFRQANANLRELEHGFRPDQYRINTVGRWALTEGLYGNPARGVFVGIKGGVMAAVSESPRLVENAAPDMPLHDKLKVRARGIARAAVAVGVSALNVFEPIKKRTRKLSLMLANKAL